MNKVGGIILLDFKTYHVASYSNQDYAVLEKEQNRTENLEIDPCK